MKAATVIDIKEKDGEMMIPVRVIPRASKNEIAGEHGGALKVRIKAPPVEGAANAELVGFLAKELKVPKRTVEVASGTSSRSKTVRISDISIEDSARIRKALDQ